MSLGRAAPLLRWGVAIIVFVIVVFSASLQSCGIAVIVFVVVVFWGSSAEVGNMHLCIIALIVNSVVVAFVVIYVLWLLSRGGK